MNIYEIVSDLTIKVIQHPSTFPNAVGYLFSMVSGPIGPKNMAKLLMSKKKEKVTLENGRKLDLQFMKCPKKYRKHGKKRVIIMSHGFQSVASFMLHYYTIYMKEGFDVVIYDQRGHGKASDLICTMGYKEGEDLGLISKYVRKKYGKGAVIGVQGESMGSGAGATALPEIAKYTDFAVLDCGYSSMDAMIRHIARLFFFLDKEKLVKMIDEKSDIDGKHFSNTEPIDYVRQTPKDYPVYFIHGGIDFFVLTHFSKDMAKAKPGNSEVHIYPLAFHALSQTLYRKDYAKRIVKWLKKNKIIK